MNINKIEILTNRKEKIISTLRRELENCDEFLISVAFITQSGITLILEQLRILQEKGVRGKILTGDYLSFTDPLALKKLMQFNNLEIKLATGLKHHAKGFFFRKGENWKVIIGSSNLTQSALTSNLEWNLGLEVHSSEKIMADILDEFYHIFHSLDTLTFETIKNYEEQYLIYKKSIEALELSATKEEKILPNLMQQEALQSLTSLRKEGKNKALLISATGTGKTYLSAFDIQQYNPKRVLFIAHRKNILSRSHSSFEKILRGTRIETHFAMVQTLNKKENLEKFEKDHFDYIIIDEVHHSGAKTYQNIINYFEPKFFLGMTATPERSDDFDIYALFDHNIAYEIRLHDALKENLLCPFHYFGISDILIDGKPLEQKATLKDLTSTQRVNHILEKSNYYGWCGEKIHALIFASSVEESQKLSEEFNRRGVKALALSSQTSEEEREKAIEDLENGKLQYLITVDIFNEGIDIPCLNQIILLRPTQSSIVYIQQLGRGLRKYKDKEYVVILDFIGNYEKNFLIPTAISQNNNFDKDFLKSFVQRGTDFLPGESTLIFDEISKDKIFENIRQSNFSTRKNIEHDYYLLKKQLGRAPLLYDFFVHNLIEPSVILKFKKNYDEVLQIFEKKGDLGILSTEEKNYLQFLSQFFTPAKRKDEMEILSEFLLKGIGTLKCTNRKNALLHLSKNIFTSLSTMKNYLPILKQISEEEFQLEENFEFSFKNNSYFQTLILDLINYNLAYVQKNYSDSSTQNILKDRPYTKQEAFWYMNLDYNNGYQVGGYTIFDNPAKVMAFITLEDNTYENNFLNEKEFYWYSKPRRYLSKDGKITKEGLIAQNYYEMEIFAKQYDGENFYYLGQVEKVLSAEEIKNEKGENIVKYLLRLK